MSKKDMNNYVDYILDVTTRLLAIDSPTGYTKEAASCDTAWRYESEQCGGRELPHYHKV